jgi:hypothetical protein
MRCDQCTKFVSLETADPEVDGENVTDNGDGTGTLTLSVRLHRDCADCGQELKEYNFDVEEPFDCPKNCGGEEDEQHDLTVDIQNEEPTESGGHRYKKNMVGFSLDAVISCSNCDFTEELHVEDSAAASWFEELI